MLTSTANCSCELPAMDLKTDVNPGQNSTAWLQNSVEFTKIRWIQPGSNL
jgi:hypothetical protein